LRFDAFPSCSRGFERVLGAREMTREMTRECVFRCPRRETVASRGGARCSGAGGAEFFDTSKKRLTERRAPLEEPKRDSLDDLRFPPVVLARRAARPRL
tara:strand:- start:176 stop:472 length:297 start_codon:yes stop_codon:yes gene_type:complete